MFFGIVPHPAQSLSRPSACFHSLPPPCSKASKAQQAHKAIVKFGDSGMLICLHWPLALSWLLRQSFSKALQTLFGLTGFGWPKGPSGEKGQKKKLAKQYFQSKALPAKAKGNWPEERWRAPVRKIFASRQRWPKAWK